MRFNLATKKMSNGVEVIVATDRSARPLEPEYLRFLSSTVTRPITLAPHTLTNLMSMVLSSEQVPDEHNRFMALIQPEFTTKTYYTTYSFRTTTLKNHSTVVTNAEMAITNIRTEPHCKITESGEIEPVKTVVVTLDASPTLKTEVFKTEYTYMNTFLDGEQPLVLSSIQTISNTLIGNSENLNELEPSEVFPSTNTYLKTVELTKTLTDGTDHHIVSTSDVVTQVVVTDRPSKKATEVPITTNVTKTYFVTYTYFSTYLEGDKTKVKSDVSVSSDVTIEKFYIKPKKTETVTFERVTRTENPAYTPSVAFPFNVMATRTYLTTFTYFTTLLHGTDRNSPETKINSRTKVIENTVAEMIPHQDFNTDYLLKLNSSLHKISGSIVATATLNRGETILVTVYKNSYQKYEIEPTRTNVAPDMETHLNQMNFGDKDGFKATRTQITLIKPSKSVSLNEPMAEALVDTEEESVNEMLVPTGTTTLTPPSANGADDFLKTSDSDNQEVTSAFSDQENLNEETESAPTPEAETEKNQLQNSVVNQTTGSSLINFNKLGINGMNVLGPVFNAMAELITNKINKNGEAANRRNDTAANKPEQVVKEPGTKNVNPLLNFVNKFTTAPAKATVEPKAKSTTPRTPVYIPVGSFGQDSESSESQNRRVLIANGQENWYEKWKDIHAKNLEKVKPHDNPVTILEGGIPISPGQVITTNSDVIIGRPGESGPRPPTFALKNDIPVDMKPPPVPPRILPLGDGDHYIGQPSTNTGVNYHFVKEDLSIKPPPPGLSPKKQAHEAQNLKVGRPHVHGHKDHKGGPHHPLKNSHFNKNPHFKYDSGASDLNPPPVPPQPVRSHDVHRPITVNHKPVHESHVLDHLHLELEHDHDHDHNHDVHSIPIKLEENYLSSSDLSPTVLTFPTVPVISGISHGSIPLISTPTPNLEAANIGSVLLVPTVGEISINPNVVDRSTGHPFLVNIQPSQVANIVIPHGSSTALIVSDGKQHSLKGEVIDDPSPHPEPETVGFVKAEPVLKLENEDISTALQNEVIPAETVEVPKTSSQLNGVLLSNQPHPTVDILKINPNPTGDLHFVNQHFPSGQNIQAVQSAVLYGHQPQGAGITAQVLQNHNIKEQNAILNHNIKVGEGIAPTEIAQNYRKEEATDPVSFSSAQNPQNLLGAAYFQKLPPNHAQGVPNYPLNTETLYSDQIRFKPKPNLVDEGVYLAVPPPERPLQQPDQPPDGYLSSLQQESLINHQSGIVSDVSLSQILTGSEHKSEVHPLKDLLIKHNANPGDSIREGQNANKKPANDFDQDLSPPPLPHRPAFVPTHQVPTTQKMPVRYRPHPPQAVPTPLDFMIPPPETSNRVRLKPQMELTRPMIPIGAGAPASNYHQPRPEDMVIVPHKTRPGFVDPAFVNDIKNKHQIPANSQVYYDLDVSDTNGAIKMEKGEEMQESVSQPMFPGQVINDVIHFNRNYTHGGNHQNIRPHRPITGGDISRNHTSNNNDGKTTGEASTETKNYNLSSSSNVSNKWPTNNRNSNANKNNHFGTFAATDSSSHATSNDANVASTGGNYKTADKIKNHKGHHHTHNKDAPDLFSLHEQAANFDSHKISPVIKRPAAGSAAATASGSFGIHGNRNNSGLGIGMVIRVPKPHSHPSGAKISGGNQGDLHKSESTQNIRTTLNGNVNAGRDPVGYPPVQVGTTSNGAFFGHSEKATDSNKNHHGQIIKDLPPKNQLTEFQKEGDNPQGHGDAFGVYNNKKPNRYGSLNQIYGSKVQTGGSVYNNSRPTHGPGGRPTKNTPSSVIGMNNNRNRIPTGQGGSNIQKRPYLPFDSFSQGSAHVQRPSGFVLPIREDNNKIPAESNGVQTTDSKNISNNSINNRLPVVSGNPSSSNGQANEFSSPIFANTNHKYGNKTINFYDSKPAFDVSKVHKTYNKEALEADKWFTSGFSHNNNFNNNHNYNNTKTGASNVLPSDKGHQNSTQSNPTSAIDSEAQMTLMIPPKIAEIKTKVDEVMGLSPPPLERPRRPQIPHRPQRPKPPMAPIAIENDFPPVRSPDFNKKPFKPQDIFPPRLPDNFVHHLPDYPGRPPPKPRPSDRPITSMPIDVPTTRKPSKPAYPYDSAYDLDDNAGVDDPYFAGSEINGHSKPVYGEIGSRIVEKPPPSVYNSTQHKSDFPSKSFDPEQHSLRIKSTDKPKPDAVYEINQSNTKPTKRDEISSTPAINASPTKFASSVTQTTTQPNKEWQDADEITGSETAFEPNQFNHHVTPGINSVTRDKQIVTNLVSTGSTTIFEGQFTQGLQSKSKTTASFESEEYDEDREETTFDSKYKIIPTQTTTLTVTTTMTTVVHSVGHKSSTKTIVLTKTLISTVFNKITETKTLVKPTTSTLYQTHTVSTIKTSLIIPSVLHPTQTHYQPGGTLKPEIFVADPHAKDTMTISVSSSMNKNKHNNINQKVHPSGSPQDQSGKESSVVFVSTNHSQEDLSDDENDEDKVEVSDEENEVIHSRVMVGGVFDAEVDKEFQESNNKEDECFPGCKAKRNELCQRIKGVMKCVCRPGFARMFPDRPCRPTYTYEVKLALEKLGPEQLNYEKNVAQSNSANMAKLASVTKEGLDRMIMQSELRDVYHGVVVNGFQEKEKKTMVDFYVQLSENTDEEKLVNIFKQTLQTSNYSLGGTELFAARESDNLDAEDFNECLNSKYHDCSEHARCFNLKGTYTCSCKEGYTDMSENTLFPGRVCSDAIGCEYCGYHGACYSKGEGQITCECFQWYSGERCNINLKVLLIALATIGVILLALLLVCGVLTCLNRRNKTSSSSRNNGYLRYRGPSSHSIDRRAMISDTSSESSLDNVPYLSSPPVPKQEIMNGKKKPVLRHVKGPIPRPLPPPGVEQRDRSVTVMIPRAKYRPPPHLSPHLTMSTFSPEKHLPKPAGSIATEQKLISYLDGNTREERTIVNNKNQNGRQEGDQHKTYDFKITSVANDNEGSRTMDKKKDQRVSEYEYKMSNMSFSEETNSAERKSAKGGGDDKFRRHSDSTHLHSDANRASQFRKYSAGALVSAGYEVSAKGGIHQLEDDIVDDDQSAVTNTYTMKSNRSQFTTLNRTGDHKTMSEARSYDETTVHPQTRSLKTNYSGSSPSSRANNDEGHTMIERDLGSTFIMPESHIFKPETDRDSDISNFDSL